MSNLDELTKFATRYAEAWCSAIDALQLKVGTKRNEQ